MGGDSRSGEVLDAIIAHRTRVGDIPIWMLELAAYRDELDPEDYDRAVALALRRSLFGDFEAPGDDPELGEPRDS